MGVTLPVAGVAAIRRERHAMDRHVRGDAVGWGLLQMDRSGGSVCITHDHVLWSHDDSARGCSMLM